MCGDSLPLRLEMHRLARRGEAFGSVLRLLPKALPENSIISLPLLRQIIYLRENSPELRCASLRELQEYDPDAFARRFAMALRSIVEDPSVPAEIGAFVDEVCGPAGPPLPPPPPFTSKLQRGDPPSLEAVFAAEPTFKARDPRVALRITMARGYSRKNIMLARDALWIAAHPFRDSTGALLDPPLHTSVTPSAMFATYAHPETSEEDANHMLKLTREFLDELRSDSGLGLELWTSILSSRGGEARVEAVERATDGRFPSAIDGVIYPEYLRHSTGTFQAAPWAKQRAPRAQKARSRKALMGGFNVL